MVSAGGRPGSFRRAAARGAPVASRGERRIVSSRGGRAESTPPFAGGAGAGAATTGGGALGFDGVALMIAPGLVLGVGVAVVAGGLVVVAGGLVLAAFAAWLATASFADRAAASFSAASFSSSVPPTGGRPLEAGFGSASCSAARTSASSSAEAGPTTVDAL